MKNSRKIAAGVGALSVAAALFVLLDGSAPAAASKDKAEEPAPTNVRVSQVDQRHVTETVRLVGETQAVRRVTISAETAGRVESVGVEIGDRVAVDQELLRVDIAMQEARNRQARAERALAEKTYRRLKKLADRGAISKQERDEAKARLTQARAVARMAQLELDRSAVVSPTAGTVVQRLVEPGEWVAPGQPVLEIQDMSRVIVEAPVPERLAGSVRASSSARVHVRALGLDLTPDSALLVPTTTDASRTFTLRLELDNSTRDVMAGMAADVHVDTAHHADALVVPQSAVLERVDGREVFVERDGKAERRSVSLGAPTGDEVVVLEGLGAEDRVVVEGHRDLADGQAIRIAD